MTEVCSSLENSTKFNAWGVVTHFQNPKTTTGTDLIMTLRITDDSITSEGLQVIIFRSAHARCGAYCCGVNALRYPCLVR